jgi:hypothetical protein
VEVLGVDHNQWPVERDWADDRLMYRELAQGLG